MISVFRGWSPLIAIQVEYSLLQRTVEGELLPMAAELGLGVTTWGPLRQGALSGKYGVDNANSVKSDRGRGFTPMKQEDYAILEEVRRIDNLMALDFQFTPSDAAALDKTSTPTLPFPAEFAKISPHLAHAGATVNGDVSRASNLIPHREIQRY